MRSPQLMPAIVRQSCLVLVFVCWCGNFSLAVRGQEAANCVPGPDNVGGWRSCTPCHEGARNAPRNGDEDWVHLNEIAIWREQDAHSQAFKALDGSLFPRTKQMEEALKIPNAREHAACLACHSVGASPQAKAYRVEGVTCEACHGASSRWVNLHNNRLPNPDLPPEQIFPWRFKTPEQKQACGMNDLRDPVVRAKVCLSCHLGNVAEGKVVTHEMFAAGHPPLPGFEMETFGQAMPSHWRHLSEKPKPIREAAKAAAYKTELANRTDAALIGALMAVRTSAKLLGDQASNKDLDWPELSHYDCAACHHDLRIPSSRQERGYGQLIPGRPSPHSWPNNLAAFAMAEGQLDKLLKPLTQVLNQRPFGERTATTAAVTAVVDGVDQEIERLRQSPGYGKPPADWYQARGAKLLNEVCQCNPLPADLDSARQLAWLLKLAIKDGGVTPAAADRQRLSSLYAQLSKQLALNVHPKGYNPADLTQKRYWQETLELSRDFDAQKCAETMHEIGQILAPRSTSK